MGGLLLWLRPAKYYPIFLSGGKGVLCFFFTAMHPKLIQSAERRQWYNCILSEHTQHPDTLIFSWYCIRYIMFTRKYVKYATYIQRSFVQKHRCRLTWTKAFYGRMEKKKRISVIKVKQKEAKAMRWWRVDGSSVHLVFIFSVVVGENFHLHI